MVQEAAVGRLSVSEFRSLRAVYEMQRGDVPASESSIARFICAQRRGSDYTTLRVASKLEHLFARGLVQRQPGPLPANPQQHPEWHYVPTERGTSLLHQVLRSQSPELDEYQCWFSDEVELDSALAES
jgi:hypothetical protein